MEGLVCAYMSICEEDACWIPQFLKEAERLRMPFAVNFDRCSMDTKYALRRHNLCVGFVSQDDPEVEFRETHKQGVFDLAVSSGVKWVMAWDVDETYEEGAALKLKEGLAGIAAEQVQVTWLNLWGDKEHVRVDGPFAYVPRVKLYTTARRWTFTHPITNGPKPVGGGPLLGRIDLTCLHHGLMTEELRRLHKARWDRIYTKAVGANPYGIWNYALDGSVKVELVENTWSPK